MLIFVDIDETICYYDKSNLDLDYSKAIPYPERINKINSFYRKGDTIVYWTARGTRTGIRWFDITYNQLKSWGCLFHELKMGKPTYDLFIDDKNINSEKYFNDTLK